MAGLQQTVVPDVILVFAAVLPWQFFSTALGEASMSLIGNTNLISKVYFPRLIIPLAAVATALVDFAITLVLLAALMAWYGVSPDARAGRLAALHRACSLLVARTGSAAGGAERDVSRFPLRGAVRRPVRVVRVTDGVRRRAQVPERWRAIYALNPLVGIIDGFRWALLGDRRLDPRLSSSPRSS